jgi:hypothetical protein
MKRVYSELEGYFGGYLSVVSSEQLIFRIRLEDVDITSRLRKSSLFRGCWQRVGGNTVIISRVGHPIVKLNIGEEDSK